MALAAFVAAFTEEPLMTSNNVTGDLTRSATGSVTGGRKLAAMNLADESVRHRVLASGPVGAWRTLPGSHNVLCRN